MVYTGGLLNELNGKMAISAPGNSVPVMKLIRIHKPKSKSELVDLIKRHSVESCSCGVMSKGSIDDFGVNLFNAQKQYWGENKFTLLECKQWEYDLFITQSMKGKALESKALAKLQSALPAFHFNESSGVLDEELRVDILISQKNLPVCGIQVKPKSFINMRSEVVTFNKMANEKWSKPVKYLYYNEHEKFVNFQQIIDEIKQLLVTG